MVTRPQDLARDRLTERVLDVCDAAGAFIEYWGFRSIHGRVWTLLAVRHSGVSQRELSEVLGVSKALVSSAISELTSYGLVRPEHEGRNAPLVAVIDVWPAVAQVLRTREWMLMERARLALEGALEEAEIRDEFGEESLYATDRIRLILHLTESAQSFLKVLVGLRLPKSVEPLGRGLQGVAKLVRSLRR